MAIKNGVDAVFDTLAFYTQTSQMATAGTFKNQRRCSTITFFADSAGATVNGFALPANTFVPMPSGFRTDIDLTVDTIVISPGVTLTVFQGYYYGIDYKGKTEY